MLDPAALIQLPSFPGVLTIYLNKKRMSVLRLCLITLPVTARCLASGLESFRVVDGGDQDVHGLCLVAIGQTMTKRSSDNAPPVAVDEAVYTSMIDSSKISAVTGEVNKLLRMHSVKDFTGGRSLNEVFGDIAPAEQKKLVLKKGNQNLEIAEVNDGAGVRYDMSGLFETPAPKTLGEKISFEQNRLRGKRELSEFSPEAQVILKDQAESLAYEWQAYEEQLEELSESFVGSLFKCPAAEHWRDGRSRYTLSLAEFKYARCPPGVITGMSAASMFNSSADATVALIKKRMSRLRSAICAAKAKGWVGGNPLEGDSYKETGYATFESSLWPKRKTCSGVVDEQWAKRTKITKRFRPDVPPKWMSKMVNADANIEFRSIWKVASTAFPEYLRCRLGAKWESVSTNDAAKPGRSVATAVRHPIARFVSAAGELLQRSVNHWCPGGPCSAKDGFDVNATTDKLRHQTTWFKMFAAARTENASIDEDWLHSVVRAMVSDTGCNYYTYAAEHLSTQSSFLAQNSGQVAPVSAILKLNEGDSQPANINRLWQIASSNVKRSGQIGKRCSLQHRNVQAEKPNGDKVPRSSEMMQILESDWFLMRDLCLIYAQDFVCFNFQLPGVCKGMF